MILLKKYRVGVLLAVLVHCGLALGFVSYSFQDAAGMPKVENRIFITTVSEQRSNSRLPEENVGILMPIQENVATGSDQYEGRDELLVHLHNAIKKNVIYPRAAIVLNQEGDVVLSLCLTPEGVLNEVLVASSSGVERLDQAALSAAKSTQFDQNLVKKTECFDLPIRFVLR